MNAKSNTVLITGASRGIGLATAQAFAQRGYRVFGTSRDPEAVSASGFELLRMDVCEQASVEACVQAVVERTGRVDILINNAGYSLSGAAEEAMVDDAKRLFETNFFGVQRVTNAVLPHQTPRRHS